jgi:hypothetical protein
VRSVDGRVGSEVPAAGSEPNEGAEQMQMVEFLNRRTFCIDSLITERSIEFLKERPSVLITAAVTGQIDLREAA